MTNVCHQMLKISHCTAGSIEILENGLGRAYHHLKLLAKGWHFTRPASTSTFRTTRSPNLIAHSFNI